MKYRIIYADPPWYYYSMNHSGKNSNQETTLNKHYNTLSLKEICELEIYGEKIKDIIEQNAVLLLWATSPRLDWAFEVIKSWGFTYKTSLIWDKVKHNVGHYASVRHELLLIGGKGKSRPDNRFLIDSVVEIERTNHSRKPEYFIEWIDKKWIDGNRIELFARQPQIRKNWHYWGYEA